MISTWNRYPAPAGLALGLAATLLLGVAGCGGKGTESGDAVVVTAPDATVPTVGSGSTAGAPAGGSSTAATAPAPAGANANANANANASATSPAAKGTVKAEGWGTLKGKVTLKGPPPPAEAAPREGEGGEEPRGLRQGRAHPVGTPDRR